MGDFGSLSEPWMHLAPRALPLGKANVYPLDELHASVIGLSRKEEFYLNKPVRDLAGAVLHRLQITDKSISCMVFRSANAARLRAADLQAAASDSQSRVLQTIRCVMSLGSNWGSSATHWASFTAVLFPCDMKKQAMAFWRDTGSGLYATYCLEEFDYLDSTSSEPTFRTPALQKRSRCQSQQSVMSTQSVDSSMGEIKTFLAQLATSEPPGQPAVNPDDVFLYPNGMNAICALSEGLASFAADSTIAAYG
ncbi:hypothetical protein BDV34DRAFT_228963 [Aspergillus parasiticus]|uniref:Uncharacterized protein n=1 Tax=Aspergillus parasiticus TaxID=5067 RepID=A0A5N6D9D7_ASPPA|nr:hypothetical protein BDV34DRAFT_228963 [Aspergillus parasiticus]